MPSSSKWQERARFCRANAFTRCDTPRAPTGPRLRSKVAAPAKRARPLTFASTARNAPAVAPATVAEHDAGAARGRGHVIVFDRLVVVPLVVGVVRRVLAPLGAAVVRAQQPPAVIRHLQVCNRRQQRVWLWQQYTAWKPSAAACGRVLPDSTHQIVDAEAMSGRLQGRVYKSPHVHMPSCTVVCAARDNRIGSVHCSAPCKNSC